MTNNPTKYESNPSSGYRGVAVTRTGRTGQKHYTLHNFVAWGMINAKAMCGLSLIQKRIPILYIPYIKKC